MTIPVYAKDRNKDADGPRVLVFRSMVDNRVRNQCRIIVDGGNSRVKHRSSCHAI